MTILLNGEGNRRFPDSSRIVAAFALIAEIEKTVALNHTLKYTCIYVFKL